MEVRNHIGFLPENNPLPEDLRVIEYLKFRAMLKGLKGSRKKIEYGLHLICDLKERFQSEKLEIYQKDIVKESALLMHC